jgi:hypothetical protein
MLLQRAGVMLVSRKGEAMYHWMDGWDWIGMTLMMAFWIVLIGAVVYIAVRLGQRPDRRQS